MQCTQLLVVATCSAAAAVLMALHHCLAMYSGVCARCCATERECCCLHMPEVRIIACCVISCVMLALFHFSQDCSA
jgi:hypothetical protein